MDYFFSHARTALKYGLRALNMKAGDEILVPACICDVVTHPLDESGIKPIFYPVSQELKPVWERLPGLLNGKTKGILAVHYFGQPQDMARFREFCKLHGILLIEDNAHGFGGSLQGKPLGTFGDIGISSPRKILGWRNGGILHFNRDEVFPELPFQPGKLRWKMKSLAKKILCANGFFCNHFRKMPDFHSQDTGREEPIPSWKMDEGYGRVLRNLDVLRLREKRRQVWGVWKQWAEANGLNPVYPGLSEGACPLAFPVRTDSARESRKWFEWGWKHGLYVHSWPALPDQVVESDKETLRLWETLVCFPIMPEMDADRLSKRLGI